MAEPLWGPPGTPGGEGTGLAQIGYQGYTPESLVDALRTAGIARLVDVRLNPVSRKRGFSKRALGEVVTAAGIAYEHLPELGNPVANRPGFGGSPAALEAARAAYAELLRAPAAAAAADRIARAALRERVALLCVEADVERCHRYVLFLALWERGQQLLAERPSSALVDPPPARHRGGADLST